MNNNRTPRFKLMMPRERNAAAVSCHPMKSIIVSISCLSTVCGPNGCGCTLKEDEQQQENGQVQIEEAEREKRGCCK
jgi:hypothetical protein